jgi:hypothetical protein
MKYSLRSLMIVMLVAPPLLAGAVLWFRYSPLDCLFSITALAACAFAYWLDGVLLRRRTQ